MTAQLPATLLAASIREAFWAGITAITHGELRDDEDAS